MHATAKRTGRKFKLSLDEVTRVAKRTATGVPLQYVLAVELFGRGVTIQSYCNMLQRNPLFREVHAREAGHWLYGAVDIVMEEDLVIEEGATILNLDKTGT